MVDILLINSIANVLNLTKTDYEILKILITKKSGLLISEITNYIKRSERNVRNRLDLLIKKGLLKKEIEVLKNKRLAHRYSLESTEKIIESSKNHLFRKIKELNNIKNSNNY